MFESKSTELCVPRAKSSGVATFDAPIFLSEYPDLMSNYIYSMGGTLEWSQKSSMAHTTHPATKFDEVHGILFSNWLPSIF